MLYDILLDRERSGEPLRVGLVGAGQMGEGLVCQMEMMHGMHAVAIADSIPGRAGHAFHEAGVDDDLVIETDDLDLAAHAIAENRRIATTSATLIPQLKQIHIIVEATGVPEVGARVALESILQKMTWSETAKRTLLVPS